MRKRSILGWALAVGLADLASVHVALAQSPPTPALPDPATATYAQCIDGEYYYGGKACLLHCITQGSNIYCDMALLITANFTFINIKPFDNTLITLVDNFRVNHSMTSISWVNGHGNAQATATMGNGDWTWISMKFDGGESDITAARIVISFPARGNANISWSGPVESVP